jgi:hypothetical protein
MTRRRLLLIFAAILAAVGGLWWSRRGGLDAAASRLVATIGPRDSAAAVGAEVLKNLPAGTAAEHLVLAITQAIGAKPRGLAEMSEGNLRVQLQARIGAEHLSGDTVSVQGWEFAITEARLYALAALR